MKIKVNFKDIQKVSVDDIRLIDLWINLYTDKKVKNYSEWINENSDEKRI